MTPQPTHQPTPTNEPANGGQLALQRELDDVWRAMNQPKTTARDMTRLYARAAELRRIISELEKQNHD